MKRLAERRELEPACGYKKISSGGMHAVCTREAGHDGPHFAGPIAPEDLELFNAGPTAVDFAPSRCLSAANKCDGVPVWRFTWPGRPEAYACFVCGLRAHRVAVAMGFSIQLLPLVPR